ncbi:MAG: hypothetical protein Tsb009_12690 [Planctomycetaceae bacterium]
MVHSFFNIPQQGATTMIRITRSKDRYVHHQIRSRLSQAAVLPGMMTVLLVFVIGTGSCAQAAEGMLRAGVAKVDITNRDAGPVNDPLFVKALVLKSKTTTAVIITVDAVAIARIGSIRDDYLKTVRDQLKKDLNIEPAHVMVNASHCHGIVCKDVAARTIQAVKKASQKLVPVKVGTGTGHEDRIMENRRLKLKNGREVDVRHAYSLAPDEEVASVGPIDPEIGILRLDREDGRTLAVVYNFACHPIQGVPSGGNTADITGFSSKVIEDNLSEGTIALFLQGCGGDINPVLYKDVNNPRDAEPLGNMLGLSTLKGVRKIKTKTDGRLQVLNESLKLPRANVAERISVMEAERDRLVRSLKGTSLNLKTFMPLAVKYGLNPQYPSYYSHRYLHEKKLGRNHLQKLDAENRRNMQRYIQNIHTMEKLTRLQTNLTLLKKRHAMKIASGQRTIDVEVVGLRVGNFVLITFPGELTVRIGLNIKKRSPYPNTFVAGYTNGYIFYAPTAEQLQNVGRAQEDSDCLLAPEWQKIFEAKVARMLKKL